MSGYFDEQAGATAAGFSHGHIQGTQEGLRRGRTEGLDAGRQDGYNIGHAEGHRTGYDTGWNDAIARANLEIVKQMEFTRQHVGDKEVLTKQLDDQSRIIDGFTGRLGILEKESVGLQTKNQNLQEVVTAFKMANERLVAEINLLEERYEKRTQGYGDQVRKYNKNMVFMNSVRLVLEDLTIGDGAQAKLVQELFVKRYTEEVKVGIKEGAIRVPLEVDEDFVKSLPNTQKFLKKMLRAGPQHVRMDALGDKPQIM